jgi:hypothetical protein
MQALSQTHTLTIVARTTVSRLYALAHMYSQILQIWLGGGAMADVVCILTISSDRLVADRFEAHNGVHGLPGP